jgi:hypothetical protein
MLALLCSIGCGPSEQRREAEHMLTAIDKLRNAAHEERAPMLASLDKERPNTAEAELARHRCHLAFSAMHAGRNMVQEVEAKMAAHKKAGTTPEPALLVTLNEAQSKVGQANERMPACNQAVRALRLLIR